MCCFWGPVFFYESENYVIVNLAFCISNDDAQKGSVPAASTRCMRESCQPESFANTTTHWRRVSDKWEQKTRVVPTDTCISATMHWSKTR